MELNAAAGDTIVVDAMHAGVQGRTGEILDVLGPVGEHHYRVRWEDGHESLFYPGSTSHAIHHVQR